MQTIGINQLKQRSNIALKTKNQIEPRRRDNMKRLACSSAISEWERTLPGQAQETIARLVSAEFHRQGGRGITVNKQNLFRYLRNEGGSEKYNGYVMQLVAAISAVLPVEIARSHGLKTGKTDAELIASAVKECSEAHHAKLMGAPLHMLKKEIIEAQIALSEMLPEEVSAPLVAFLSGLFPQCF